jgi:1,4-dihydroxy-2-naphthoate octaprenyltransferase
MASFLVQMGRYDNTILTASVPLFFQMLGLMMVVESPDFAADIRVGRRNLVVRLGRLTSWRLGFVFLILAAASAFYSGLFDVPWPAATVAGAFLMMEALYVYLAEAHTRSMAVMFWSTAIVCGFYLLVIAVLAAGFALS